MKTLVVAPHPDDKRLICGGLMLRRVPELSQIGVAFMVQISPAQGWKKDLVVRRLIEIRQVTSRLGLEFENIFQLGFQKTRLGEIPISTPVQKMSAVVAL